MFSSKRQAGLFTRPYLSYVDAAGTVHKPFVLPQKDPSFYESCCGVYSMPEFVTGPLTVTSEALVRAATAPRQIDVNTVTGATPQAAEPEAYTQAGPLVQ